MKSVHAIAIHNCNAVRTCIIQQCPPGLLGASRKKETNGRDRLCCKLDSTRLRRFNSAQQLAHSPRNEKDLFFLFFFYFEKPKNLFKSNQYQIGLFLQGKNVHSVLSAV